jgi:hypothetical protein
MTQYDFTLAPEIEAEAQKIRDSWSTAERKHRKWVRPRMPAVVVTAEEIQKYRAGREQRPPLEFAEVPRPAWLTPFKLPPDEPVSPPPKLRRKPKPAPLPGPAIRPLGEVIAEHIARILGGKAGAV